MSRAFGLRLAVLALACLASLGTPLQSRAGLLNGNGNAIPGWTGTTPFITVTPDGNLSGTVDWSVFAPGNFPYTNYTPTAGQLVYSYQVFLDAGSFPMSQFQVLVDDPANNVGHFNDLGGVIPSTDSLNFLSDVNWTWTGGVPGGGMSYGLAFSSDRVPEFQAGAVVDHGSVAYTIPIPSTSAVGIPEPGMVPILMVAAAFIRRRKRTV